MSPSTVNIFVAGLYFTLASVNKLSKDTADAPYVVMALNTYYTTLTNAIPRLAKLSNQKQTQQLN